MNDYLKSNWRLEREADKRTELMTTLALVSVLILSALVFTHYYFIGQYL